MKLLYRRERVQSKIGVDVGSRLRFPHSKKEKLLELESDNSREKEMHAVFLAFGAFGAFAFALALFVCPGEHTDLVV